MLLVEAFKRFEQEQRIRGNSPATLDYYRDCFHSFYDWFQSFWDFQFDFLSEVSRQDIKNWLCYLADSPLSSASVATYFTGIRAFFRWCFSEKLMDEDIMQ